MEGQARIPLGVKLETLIYAIGQSPIWRVPFGAVQSGEPGVRTGSRTFCEVLEYPKSTGGSARSMDRARKRKDSSFTYFTLNSMHFRIGQYGNHGPARRTRRS